jgi:hypothetical protein
MAISASRSDSKRPAQGLAITAIAAARRVGGDTARPISTWVSSTIVASLRMLAFIAIRPLP